MTVDGERLYIAWSQFDARDEASVHVAALEDGSMVDERMLSTAGRVARTPQILPMGDCTSLVTWSEGDLSSAWELAEARISTAGIPATGATATLLDDEVATGFGSGEVILGLELAIGDEDRGVSRIELTASEGIEFTGDASLFVDGDAVDGTATVDGQVMVFDSDVNIDTDGAQLELRFDVVPAAAPGEMGTIQVVLMQGLEACVLAIDDDFTLRTIAGGPGDDDTGGGDDDDGCECRAGAASVPGAVGIVLGLVGLAFVRRRHRSRVG